MWNRRLVEIHLERLFAGRKYYVNLTGGKTEIFGHKGYK